LSDVFTKKKRSEMMSRISGKDTKPEILVRKFLFSLGFRYRKNDKRYPGKPDIVLPKYKTAIFVHGCFWHRHLNCQLFKWPKSNREFWKKKLEGNAARDQKNKAELESLGWKVITVWECEMRNIATRVATLEKLVFMIR